MINVEHGMSVGDGIVVGVYVSVPLLTLHLLHKYFISNLMDGSR